MVTQDEVERLKDFYEFFLMLRTFVSLDILNIDKEVTSEKSKKILKDYLITCEKDYKWSFVYFKEPFLFHKEENCKKISDDIYHMNFKIAKFFEYSDPVFAQYYPDFVTNKNSSYLKLKQKYSYLIKKYLSKR